MEQLLGAANRVGIAICNYAPAMNAMTEFNPWSKKMLTLCTLSLSLSLSSSSLAPCRHLLRAQMSIKNSFQLNI